VKIGLKESSTLFFQHTRNKNNNNNNNDNDGYTIQFNVIDFTVKIALLSHETKKQASMEGWKIITNFL
jgi:hypothetical protein